MGTFSVFRAFLPLVHAGARKVVVNVSSELGSLADVESGAAFGAAFPAYGVAKAGLNMLVRRGRASRGRAVLTARADTQDGEAVPGRVHVRLRAGVDQDRCASCFRRRGFANARTDLGGADAPNDVGPSVTKHIKVYETVTVAKHSGKFINVEGRETEW